LAWPKPALEDVMKICRTIRVEIQQNPRAHPGDDDGSDRLIRPAKPPHDVIPAATYLAGLLPGHAVERVGGAGIADFGGLFGGRRGMPSPSSLFFQTLAGCFAHHYPLVIRPEVLMHLIVYEVATTVKEHPDDYRAIFTKRASGRMIVKVRDDRLMPGNPGSPWDEAIGLFEPALRKVVPAGIMQHLLPALSTATVETRAASLVAFMDAASPYYDFRVSTLCGMPEIRLAGEPEDYRKISAAAAQLAEAFSRDLGAYFKKLLPVLKKIADQAAGARLDNAFWMSIYGESSTSGRHTFGGWSTAFIHHTQTVSGGLVQKPEREAGVELEIGCIPSQVSVVPFVWKYLKREYPMLFAGGVLGVDVIDGALAPRLTYAVVHAKKG
jgi:uncharacterized protein DUF4419